MAHLVEEEHAPDSDGATGGVFGDRGANTTVQLGYGNKKWGAALAYRYGQCDSGNGGGYVGKVSCKSYDVYSQNYALNGFWKPSETGYIPAISAGYGWSSIENGSSDYDTANWMVGLTWAKVANTPHTFNFGFGVPQYQTDGGTDAPDLSWEASLKMKVANNITVVPAIFYIPEQVQGASDDEVFGGVVQTVFKF